jgi:hypothetical protein
MQATRVFPEHEERERLDEGGEKRLGLGIWGHTYSTIGSFWLIPELRC